MYFCSTAGCPFGEACHFRHHVPGGYKVVEQMLNKNSIVATSQSSRNVVAPLVPNGSTVGTGGGMGGRLIAPPGLASSFGASSKAKISVKASLAGAIIGKGGENSKQICYQTGAKLSIREHESDPNLRNIELVGSFEQIENASNMVRELILTGSMLAPPKSAPAVRGAPPKSAPAVRGAPAPLRGNFKTKLCQNFAKGSCAYGERCHFAHGAANLRKLRL